MMRRGEHPEYGNKLYHVTGYRDVYAHPEHPAWVLKIAKRDRYGCIEHNRREWRIWNQYEGLREWLAPCVSISEDGRELIQVRGVPMTEQPRRIPDCFEDFKARNWVMLDGRPVMCDYGHTEIEAKLKKRGGRWSLVNVEEEVNT